MVKKGRGPPSKGLWAYAYDITLSDEDKLPSIQRLLDEEHSDAREGARTWAGQVVVEPQVTRILVVSDSPARDRDVNRRLEAELRALSATFVVTEPMLVADDIVAQAKNGPRPKL